VTQETALTILKTGANVFLTGEPGSGKSHTVNAYVAYLASKGIEASVTASTGIAATHIDGMTVHSWCGIGVKEFLTDYDLDLIAQKEKVVRRVRSAHVLIIDEISMLSASTLDMVDQVCRMLRNSERAFGGLQVVFVGDFFQLPPVVKTKQYAPETMSIEYDEPHSPFAFTAYSWKRANPLVCYLHEQHRQEDKEFLELLAALRRGKPHTSHHTILQARNVEPKKSEIPTKLFPHNANVDTLNERELAKLPGTYRTYTMTSRGAPILVDTLKRNCLSPETLTLKIGAKVLFTKNDPEGDYVNGTMGEVVDFAFNGQPIVRLKSGRRLQVEPVEWSIVDGNKKLAEITQLPLRLAWAITVHKSQGMSLDSALMDLSQAFEYGQGYVALSRVRTLKGLYLIGFNQRALEVHPEVLEKDESFREQSETTEEAFGKMPKSELVQMHEDFIRACGGSSVSKPKETASRAAKRRWS
jgi:ATP-dependent exoDNAse (exonuclease V) alpha subunit